MTEQAVILVGGLGTRLGALTKNTPKPLLPVGGIPFLNLLIREVKRYGVKQIVLLAGFQGELIKAAAKEWPDTVVLIEQEPLGTGGALLFGKDYLENEFFLLNGDSIFDVDMGDLATLRGAVGALALRHVEDASRFGPVKLELETITQFLERPKQPGPGLINGGVGIFSHKILEYIPTGRGVSLEKEVYPVLAQNGLLRGRIYNRPFIDIGIPSDFARAQTLVPAILARSTGPETDLR